MNAAQQIHEFLGVPIADGKKQAHGNENASTTKAGPGRYHKQGLKEARKPKQRGAGADFASHDASPKKKARRELVKAVGRRQAIKLQKIERSLSRDFSAGISDYVEAPAEA